MTSVRTSSAASTVSDAPSDAALRVLDGALRTSATGDARRQPGLLASAAFAGGWKLKTLGSDNVLKGAVVTIVLALIKDAEGLAPRDDTHSQRVSRLAVAQAGALLISDIADNPRNVVVATDAAGLPVGAAGFVNHGTQGIEVTSILSFVPPGSRVGTALLQGLFDRAVKANPSHPDMRLQAIPGSEEFYRKAGGKLTVRTSGDGTPVTIVQFTTRPK